ncbi:MAG: helix-turn-helix domain-containing protein [Bacilli bacterium]|nr:helix-turn-helix transcriptional regulator [Bacillota bacterium]NLI52124.1 helix-turn-helix transcriptional regulator [Erysipelotrichaceae bacterium]OQC09830.1 MAG: HTH-type transcriptional regulator SinR [Tenericutes bacterium ADurb.Bin087]OQC49476.1 MAG: HTH-type transcriptional regulator SinR [Tenericutes bacterium ADurb.Bin024]HOA10918.1 helix-turn-helix transcriptional regulator [Bacilli bacterium]
MEINEAFGIRLRQLRKAKGWSLLELSVRANVNHNYLCDLENGRRNPTLALLYRISEAFGITLSSLLLGIELIQ